MNILWNINFIRIGVNRTSKLEVIIEGRKTMDNNSVTRKKVM